MTKQPVTILFTADEAVVLFDWLTRVIDEVPAVEHGAERRVLSDLVAMLEAKLTAPLDPAYDAIVASARARILSDGE